MPSLKTYRSTSVTGGLVALVNARTTRDRAMVRGTAAAAPAEAATPGQRLALGPPRPDLGCVTGKFATRERQGGIQLMNNFRNATKRRKSYTV